jgi:hypothetical protein
LFHRDKLHAHTFVGLAPLHDGGRSYLACWRIKQQFDDSSRSRRFRSENIQTTPPDIVHSRDNSPVGSLPGQNHPLRTSETRVTTKLVFGRHGDTNERPSLSVRNRRPSDQHHSSALPTPSVSAITVPTRDVFWKAMRKSDLSNVPRADLRGEERTRLENCSCPACRQSTLTCHTPLRFGLERCPLSYRLLGLLLVELK